MAQQREKPWLKNKNHLDKTDKDNTKGKKAELLVFDFSDDAASKPATNEPEQKSSPRKNDEETTPRDTGIKGKGTPDESLDSNRSPRQESGENNSPRGPAVDNRSPRNEPASPRKGDNQPKAAETRTSRRASPQRNGYDADTSDSNDKPARRGKDQSPERAVAAAKMNGGKPKLSDASPRPSQPARPVRNTFTGKSTLSLWVALHQLLPVVRLWPVGERRSPSVFGGGMPFF